MFMLAKRDMQIIFRLSTRVDTVAVLEIESDHESSGACAWGAGKESQRDLARIKTSELKECNVSD